MHYLKQLATAPLTISLPLLLLALDSSAQPSKPDNVLARADDAWERRAEGFDCERASPEAIAAAVSAYEEALQVNARDLDVIWKLLRALYFQGDYATDSRDKERRKAIFNRGREVIDEALNLLAERVGGRDRLHALPPERFPEYFPEPEVAKIYYWGTANWGRWGQAFGKFAAARQGIAKKVRDYSLVVIALDPDCEDAGGYRILGRLHTEAPRIPLITGWISRDLAISNLRKAVARAPEEPSNHYYLADALLRIKKEAGRAEAIAILRRLEKTSPREHKFVEDFLMLKKARTHLQGLRKSRSAIRDRFASSGESAPDSFIGNAECPLTPRRTRGQARSDGGSRPPLRDPRGYAPRRLRGEDRDRLTVPLPRTGPEDAAKTGRCPPGRGRHQTW